MATQEAVRTTYRMPHFERDELRRDRRFRGGPEPCQAFVDFEVETLDGGRIRKQDFAGRKPVLFTLGSVTDPMTAAALPLLKRLHKEYGDQIEFVTLYVRESHPGDKLRQPETIEEKRELARRLQERDGIPWTIAIDTIDGELHRRIGMNPNSTYAVDENGNVAYRVLWSADETGLREAIDALLFGGPYGQSTRRVMPILGGIGMMDETLEQAGPEARKQALKQAAPIYGLSKLAGVFRPLAPAARGAAAVGVTALAAFALVRALIPSKRYVIRP